MSVTKNLRDGVFTVIDGTLPIAKSFELVLDSGDLTWTEVQNVNQITDRGVLSHMRKGDEEAIAVSFSIKYVELRKQTAASIPTLYEVLKFIGAASGWTSTNDDCGDVKTLTLQFDITSPCGLDEGERFTFTKFYQTSIEFAEGDEFNTLNVEGVGFVKEPTITKLPIA